MSTLPSEAKTMIIDMDSFDELLADRELLAKVMETCRRQFPGSPCWKLLHLDFADRCDVLFTAINRRLGEIRS